ncbi:MAG: 5'-nucleotidase C-terminal domain-containing protein [Elusimicrobiota bacterium]|jgi:5'-nucleotidase|nr:5'-nucleotidase C-terminal domain-containing protein [Elusimicrobiota bacterium]
MQRFWPLLLPPLLFCACLKKTGPQITLLHTNDIQGFYWARPDTENQNKETGGLAVLKKMLEREDGALLFDSGDTFSKTQEGQLGGFNQAVERMNNLGYTAATLSAADFALGWENLAPALKLANFSFVISNLQNAGGETPQGVSEYIIIERSGVKIAVLGVISKAAFPRVQRNAGLIVLDETEAVKTAAAKAQDEGANIIILLSSLGAELDAAAQPDEKTLAEEIPELTLILGGNAEVAPHGYDKISNTWISRARPGLLEAEKITLSFDSALQVTAYQNEQILLAKELYGEDETLAQAIAQGRDSAKQVAARQLTELKQPLEIYPDKQSSLGVFTADCIRRWGSNDIGIINSDLFLTGFQAGPLTQVDLLNAIPYTDRVMIVRMRGDELKNALEHSINTKTNWPQTSGLEVSWNPAAPPGQKIKKIFVGGAPLHGATIYTISTSDHIVAGGFGHEEFLNVFQFANTKSEVRDILRWCVNGRKTIPTPSTNQWKEVK